MPTVISPAFKEVAASATPDEVVHAIIDAGIADKAPPLSFLQRVQRWWLQILLCVLILMGMYALASQDVWAKGRDTEHHAILEEVEANQIHRHLGPRWTFGDADVEAEHEVHILPTGLDRTEYVSIAKGTVRPYRPREPRMDSDTIQPEGDGNSGQVDPEPLAQVDPEPLAQVDPEPLAQVDPEPLAHAQT